MPETRTWCTFDVQREELTLVQDGEAGIKVLSIPLDDVLTVVPAEFIL